MTKPLKLPVGMENLKEIRTEGFDYVDKTKLIKQLLEQWGKVNLFTRPRRFGKTLNMSMLQCFFEIGTDPALFDGLFISQNKDLCETYLGKFPVIFLSLKNVDGLTFEEAQYHLSELIGMEPQNPDAGIIIEVKYSSSFTGLEKSCDTALMQIKERRYDEKL